ncbi:Legumain [Lamellibrachia satsuma]|nr:Legumain [Lamellibrachia satsuma]
MTMSPCVLLVLCIVFTVQGRHEDGDSKHWALIVAGSSGYDNYRHQADACHAYQIMLKHGIPEERIVLMMYDDVAHDRSNPTPGVLINHPNGPDVYGGVKIDYREKDVTPTHFLNVLLGKTSAMKGIGSGKVINSGPNDNVFVNFVDHGSPWMVSFPSGILTAWRLKKAIKHMYTEKRYKQMVFYVEACESGSMFHHFLPQNINVYATTAASGMESSYACYYSKKYRTYLGDVYSVKWMEDSDAENLKNETLLEQYEIVKKETSTSHVHQYGEMSISGEPVGDFQGGKDFKSPKPMILPKVPMDAVPSGDVPMAILRHRLVDTNDLDEKIVIINEIKLMIKSHQVIRRVVRQIVKTAIRNDLIVDYIHDVRLQPSDFVCYEPALEMFHEKCFNLNKHEYALRHLYTLVNLCEVGVTKTAILQSIVTVCNGSHLSN